MYVNNDILFFFSFCANSRFILLTLTSFQDVYLFCTDLQEIYDQKIISMFFTLYLLNLKVRFSCGHLFHCWPLVEWMRTPPLTGADCGVASTYWLVSAQHTDSCQFNFKGISLTTVKWKNKQTNKQKEKKQKRNKQTNKQKEKNTNRTRGPPYKPLWIQ